MRSAAAEEIPLKVNTQRRRNECLCFSRSLPRARVERKLGPGSEGHARRAGPGRRGMVIEIVRKDSWATPDSPALH